MPHYEISHTTPLSATQRTHLASAITTLHCTTFSAASIFVNITFHDHHHHEKAKQTGYTKTTFVGGKEVSSTIQYNPHPLPSHDPSIHPSIHP
ncbi:hypothetical protein P280DRAFT_465708 [Massarina eburnea CBS 473.64]|uniref:Tautomerase cis-CaaD-like domain-containing protein n=1 Tax=Massarina eburnea CBS 473.64 TaxID=1395130 RepID=A0A6A6SFA6_9PLEO|nr:hypothetical protein P280DRAFT_465708 [Massarina eburnea CBS 473.64]